MRRPHMRLYKPRVLFRCNWGVAVAAQMHCSLCWQVPCMAHDATLAQILSHLGPALLIKAAAVAPSSSRSSTQM